MNKILIIDDEKDICFLISEILKDENYLTYSAVNSEEAIKKFNELNPDLGKSINYDCFERLIDV